LANRIKKISLEEKERVIPDWIILLLVIHEAQIPPPNGFCLDLLHQNGLFIGLLAFNGFRKHLHLWLSLHGNFSFLVEEMAVVLDDGLDREMLDHHFLVMAVALGRSPRLYCVTHQHVNLNLLSLLGRKFKKFHVSLQEIDVSSLLGLAP
jgi:hypothetical protein